MASIQKSCKRCGDSFSTNKSAVKECDVCKGKKFCKFCGKEVDQLYYIRDTNEKVCLECRVSHTHIKCNEHNQYEWIECKICGFRGGELSAHLKIHGVEAKDYGLTKSQKLIDKVKGSNNPGYQHGGRLSPWSKKSEHHSPEDAAECQRKALEKAMKNDNHGTKSVKIEYYIAKGMSEEEAAIALSKRQTTFSLEKCVENHGPIEGVSVWQERQEKWMKSFKKVNFSTISQKLFLCLMDKYDGDVYFATNNRPEMADYENKEYILKLEKSWCRPDFICLKNKKVIEFDGDYWHSEAVANPTREKIRDAAITEQGYEVHHVKEYDFKNNKDEVIKQCLNFLNQ